MNYTTKDSGKRQTFTTGMVRDTSEDKARFDLLLPKGVPYEEQLLTRFAMLLARWAIRYEERNWEKAETKEEYERFKESLLRHTYQYLCWDLSEDHAAAILFNVLWAETVLYKMSTNDTNLTD